MGPTCTQAEGGVRWRKDVHHCWAGHCLRRVRFGGVRHHLLDNHIILSVGEWATLVAQIDFFVISSYNNHNSYDGGWICQ